MTDLADIGNVGDVDTERPLFPLDRRRCPLSLPLEYPKMRAECPVAPVTNRMTGQPVWALTRYDDVRQVLGDPAMSSNGRLPGYPHQFQVPPDMLEYIAFPFAVMDPPEHTVRRKMVLPEFTAKRIADLRPRFQEIVDKQIDAMLEKGAPADLVADFAIPVPALLLCELLGADPESVDTFKKYAETTTGHDSSMEAVAAALAVMDEYLDELLDAKAKTPGDDLLSRMVAKLGDEPTLEQEDLVAIARLLVIAGSDTTANVISLGLVLLLEHPEQLAEIRNDLSLLPNAIEEMLRFLSILDGATVRVATKDIELSGTTVRSGEGILALNGAANWDESRYPDPERFDIRRNADGHLAFSFGGHMCPGANMARMQLEIVFSSLLTRLPNLRVTVPTNELPFMFDAHAYGLNALPITW